MRRPSDEALREARATLRSLVSDGSSGLPSLNLVADSIRLELEKSGQVALLYVRLERYGRLEDEFGHRIFARVLDAVAAGLTRMVGDTLRRLDVVADFTLADDAFIVLLSPPRESAVIAPDDVAAVTRRVDERLQAILLNDLAPGVYDRVHPALGAAILRGDAGLTFEQSLQQGLALAMESAAVQAAVYADELESALRQCLAGDGLEPLFEPIVDLVARDVVGHRSSVRGPFYSPLRLPDVLKDVARRAHLVDETGAAAREKVVAAAVGLRPRDLLFLPCAVSELPQAAVIAVSGFYSLNPELVPQQVVFELDADDMVAAGSSFLNTVSDVRDLGFLVAVAGAGAGVPALDLAAEAEADFVCLDPSVVRGLGADPTRIDTVQLLVRFAARAGARLVALGVDGDEERTILRRSGVELLCGAVVARPDTRPPAVSFRD